MHRDLSISGVGAKPLVNIGHHRRQTVDEHAVEIGFIDELDQGEAVIKT